MPVYEYYCKTCDRVADLWMSINDSDEQECTECGKSMKRMISKPTIEFKGNGWAADGYSKPETKTNEESK